MPTLDWTGKSDALKTAKNIPYRLLDYDPSLSCGEKNSGNLIVQGDNLAALKSLLPFYRARVKCIYIDPPYNTHSAFEHYDDNLEHSAWLSMMYPRLELLREFLSDDGAIFISIDDNEQAHLKLICDEIFGAQNFIANVIWEKKYSPQNDAKWLSDNHDFILVYALNKNLWRPNLLPRTAEMDARYKNPDNDPRGAWMSDNLSAKTYNANCDYPITTPSGRIVNPPASRAWIFNREKFNQLVADNRIWFGKDGNGVPRVKKFLSEVQQGSVSKTIWFRDEVGDNQDAKHEIKNILSGADIFDTPKPTRLIEKILRLATEKNSIVLDAFAGSGTTAHAVINLNNSDGGARKFILIEEKEYCRTITAERVKRVGGSFDYCRLGAELFDETGAINSCVNSEELAAYIWHKFTRTPYTEKNLPLIGIHNGTAYYLLAKEILTTKLLETLPAHDGAKIIFGAACLIDEDNLKLRGITFQQIPYKIKT